MVNESHDAFLRLITRLSASPRLDELLGLPLLTDCPFLRDIHPGRDKPIRRYQTALPAESLLFLRVSSRVDCGWPDDVTCRMFPSRVNPPQPYGAIASHLADAIRAVSMECVRPFYWHYEMGSSLQASGLTRCHSMSPE
ncbi:hypothetical protein T310_6924 [Rasamsonia emersonii CBS 393.64]|uniref:Uncharacterized protein n=1 Tax=Rasamsonia emersonii (strain ATCC 16479 / CBS 393.64 / IMI 116815) TaxID=1408163 RepID=A0A0F4YLC4_RASE3|nr:hypothetical protein T310_6924 [Rasamsonia emersonii CBS 393.64]KKA19102.1 hypothetical protein T310_6924 [Rasamsonia emersonii CBS 393.64]